MTPPKSVDLLMAFASESTRAKIIKAHAAANATAIEHMGTQLEIATGQGGQRREKCDGMAVASFLHFATREGERGIRSSWERCRRHTTGQHWASSGAACGYPSARPWAWASSSPWRAANGSAWGEIAGVFTGGTSKALAGAAVGALQAVGWMMIAICSTLFVFAGSVAVFLPMLPFLLFFGAALGWLLLCIEAVIAAPLWAVMHLNPHGDGLAGNARAGYMLLLGVLLRPAFITLGYVAALTALGPVLGAFNEVFASVFKMSQTGSLTGLGTSILMLAIYFGAVVYLIKHCVGFIHKVGDNLLRWVGGGKEQMGEAATGLGGAGEKIAGTAGAAAVAAATKSSSRRAGGGGGKQEGKEGGKDGGKEQPGAATTEKQDAMPDSDSPSARGAAVGDAGCPQTATEVKPGGIQQAPARSSQARPTRGPGEQ